MTVRSTQDKNSLGKDESYEDFHPTFTYPVRAPNLHVSFRLTARVLDIWRRREDLWLQGFKSRCKSFASLYMNPPLTIFFSCALHLVALLNTWISNIQKNSGRLQLLMTLKGLSPNSSLQVCPTFVDTLWVLLWSDYLLQDIIQMKPSLKSMSKKKRLLSNPAASSSTHTRDHRQLKAKRRAKPERELPRIILDMKCTMWAHFRVHYPWYWQRAQTTWDTPGFREYHRRMQLFILLYIEAGSYIVEDEDSWEFVSL